MRKMKMQMIGNLQGREIKWMTVNRDISNKKNF